MTAVLSWQNWHQYLAEYGMNYGLRVVYAVAILLVGWWLAKLVKSLFGGVLRRRQMEETVRLFLTDILYVLLLAFVVIAALSKLGIQTASLIAAVGAVGFAIALSLRNSVSNFASGVLLVANHPFSVGDFVELGSTSGTVEKITLLFTVLKTSDNQIISMPNVQVMNNRITNYSLRDTRRMNIVVGIGYDDDIALAKKLMLEIAAADARILQDPAPMVAVKELADSSVNLLFRVWTQRTDYWQTLYDCNEQIKLKFDAHGVNIPFPQQDVHLYKKGCCITSVTDEIQGEI